VASTDAHDARLGIAKVVTIYDPRSNIKEITTYYTLQRANREEDEDAWVHSKGLAEVSESREGR
jgi:hypothetical protein